MCVRVPTVGVAVRGCTLYTLLTSLPQVKQLRLYNSRLQVAVLLFNPRNNLSVYLQDERARSTPQRAPGE